MGPIRHSITVSAAPEVAFEVFTIGMGGWWDAAYTPDPDSFDGIAIGAEAGSPVALVHGTTSYPFGRVTVWEPGVRYLQTFWLAMDPAHPSTLQALFVREGEQTRVDLEHGGWTEENLAVRAKYGDWGHLLDRYAAAVAERG